MVDRQRGADVKIEHIKIGSNVYIDDAKDIKCRVIGILNRFDSVEVELSWFMNGLLWVVWILYWRLSEASE